MKNRLVTIWYLKVLIKKKTHPESFISLGLPLKKKFSSLAVVTKVTCELMISQFLVVMQRLNLKMVNSC